MPRAPVTTEWVTPKARDLTTRWSHPFSQFWRQPGGPRPESCGQLQSDGSRAGVTLQASVLAFLVAMASGELLGPVAEEGVHHGTSARVQREEGRRAGIFMMGIYMVSLLPALSRRSRKPICWRGGDRDLPSFNGRHAKVTRGNRLQYD